MTKREFVGLALVIAGGLIFGIIQIGSGPAGGPDKVMAQYKQNYNERKFDKFKQILPMNYFREWSNEGVQFLLNSYGTPDAKAKLEEEGIKITSVTVEKKHEVESNMLKEGLRSAPSDKNVFQDEFYEDLAKVIEFKAKLVFKSEKKDETRNLTASAFACKVNGNWKLVATNLFPYYSKMYGY